MEYTKEELRRIGRNVASGWGASLVSVEVRKDKSVCFLCDEHGERFAVTLQHCELKKYNY